MIRLGDDNEKVAVVVPWANREQIERFLEAWRISESDPLLVLEHDRHRDGCGVTKNKGVDRACAEGVDVVVVLDDDCFPTTEAQTLHGLALAHLEALRPQKVVRFACVTEPLSRGTPYRKRTMTMPVAASMGFWLEVGDYCAVRQLVYGPTHIMKFQRETIFGNYFALCGMNLAFRPRTWRPWCDFIDVPRFDDIWMGWLWQREAYRQDFCFNLAGPLVRHSRQSNVWTNLRDEARWLEKNETLWEDIARCPDSDYQTLRSLLPV